MNHKKKRLDLKDVSLDTRNSSSELQIPSSGILHIVATPIGNLEDITIRALRILKKVDFILCEDKRVTSRLLNKYKIKSQLIKYYKFNEQQILSNIISHLKKGRNIALVSDAGTPLVSDPGNSLIQEVIKNKITVSSVPGPSALTCALALCPFYINEFLFLGFLPSEKNKRHKLITSLRSRANNIILFIAPHDFKKYLSEIYDIYPEADVFYARELTKIYEEHWSGKIKELMKSLENKILKGEFVLILNFEHCKPSILPSTMWLVDLMKDYISSGYSLKEASKYFSEEFDLPSNKLYTLYLKYKN